MKSQELGSGKTQPQTNLDTFELQQSENSYVECIEFQTQELTALCPVTGQPDLYDCVIEYRPGKLAIETKSLKLYLWHFRDMGIFAEELAQVISRDVQAVTGAAYVDVTLTQQVRGGIKTTVSAVSLRGES